MHPRCQTDPAILDILHVRPQEREAELGLQFAPTHRKPPGSTSRLHGPVAQIAGDHSDADRLAAAAAQHARCQFLAHLARVDDGLGLGLGFGLGLGSGLGLGLGFGFGLGLGSWH